MTVRRTGIRTTRRLSPCYRHPDEPHTGICPSCLRERLSGLDSSSTAAAPELRRCRSVVCEALASSSSFSFTEPRRNSCDVVSSARSSLSNLFDHDDDVNAGSEVDPTVESKNLGRTSYYTIIDEGFGGIVDAEDIISVSTDDQHGEFRTMKEYIDLEFQNNKSKKKSKDLRDLAGNIIASLLSRKWRHKNNNSMMHNSSHHKSVIDGDTNRNEIFGRRSCDTFSVDAGRRISVEEPRASWDGYMIAKPRTIPRLAPMLYVVENRVLGNADDKFENHRPSIDGPMHSIVEDESSSGGSRNSNSDSSSSMMQSSFDRSSSVRSLGKKVESCENHGVSPANVKLVITEKELKDWRLNSGKDKTMENSGSFPGNNTPTVTTGNLNVPNKKSVRWHKIYNVFGFRSKNKFESAKENVIDPSIDYVTEKQGNETGEYFKDINDWKLTRSSSVVGPRGSCEAIGSNYRRRSVDSAGGWAYKGVEEFATASLENGITPFYMTPLRSLRCSKSGKFKLQNSHSIAGKTSQLK